MDNRPWAALLIFLSLLFSFVAWAKLAHSYVRPSARMEMVESAPAIHWGETARTLLPDAMLYVLASGVERVREEVEKEVAGQALEALIATFHPDTQREIAENCFLARMRKYGWRSRLLHPLVQRRILDILWDETHAASVSGYSRFRKRRDDLEVFIHAIGFDLESVGITENGLDQLEQAWDKLPGH